MLEHVEGHSADAVGVAAIPLPRLMAAYDAALETKFIARSENLMHNSSEWIAIRPESRTAGLSINIFQYLVRGVSLVHKQRDGYTNYPCKLLACFAHPELIPEIRADYNCSKRMGAWARSVYEHHQGALDTEDGRADLYVSAGGRDKTLKSSKRS